MSRSNKKMDPAFDEFFRAMQAYFLHHLTQVKNEMVTLINKNHEESKCFNGNDKLSLGASNCSEPCEDNSGSNKKLFTLCQSIKLGQNEINLMLESGEESIENLLAENRSLRETVNELNLRVQNLSEQLDATKASNEENFMRYENSLKEYLKISVDSNIILRALVSDVMKMKYDIMMSKKTARDSGIFEGAGSSKNTGPLRLGNVAAGAAGGPPGEYVRDVKDVNVIAETIADTLRVDGPSTDKCAAFFRPKSISIQFQSEETLDEWLKAAKQRREINERNIYQQLIELEEDNVVVNKTPFDCTICLTPVDRGGGIVLKECLHLFCRDCLAQTIEYNEDAVVRCPFRGENGEICNHNLLEREIREIIPHDIYEKHLSRSLSLSESKIKNSFHCRAPDCCGWWVVEDEVTFISCPVCTADNCIRCRAIHPTMDCKEYQDELVILAERDPNAQRTLRYFRQMKERGEAMSCPTCKITVMKTDGCDYCQCTMCKTDICWATMGPRWGPAGRGDVSGGCRCNVNGFKCHPNCSYCH
ncbi:ranBP-type and C3HC4-type zinc finger-containing protein 1 isoform X1 [Nilaparvata lugens]|uniref:ranBP-type and C3HC4-type zinc finger-containing protein 1 isoform X1 n=1 Tax=Nilaparvata lugens TaxID=108931 RepID=UPI00193D8AA9|nr:ranBP-type and C3HC4-type zinc finger-containing protein 1 isoform X1 [Nilaparvata lugens]